MQGLGMSEREKELEMRIKQLEDDYKQKQWILPREPDRNLKFDEWWAYQPKYDDPTLLLTSKIQPSAVTGQASVFKVVHQNRVTCLEIENAALKERVRIATEALEFECGNRCHPEHNPCSAREALAKLAAGKGEG